MFLGLRTAIYPAPDLGAAKAFWTPLLGDEPYFDEPFYVGYNVGGYELALDPNADIDAGVTTYWGVAGCEAAIERLAEAGATVLSPAREVGGGILVATLELPIGSVLGVIENPHFELRQPSSGAGPGR